MEYFLHVLILIAIYSIVGASFYLLVGSAGLLSISQAAFYGIGAYTAGLLTVSHTCGFPAGLIIAALVAGLAGAMVGSASLRLRDDFLVLATFAFQAIAVNVENNWIALTNGPLGVVGIPRPVFEGVTFNSNGMFLYLVTLLALTMNLIAWRIGESPFGRVLRAIREDELFAESLGKPVNRYKVQVYSIAAAFAGVAGALYAHYVTFIDPSSFTLSESIFMLSIAIVGGARSLMGCFVGVVVLVTLPECLRLFNVPAALVGNIRQLFYGGLLVLFVMFRPNGLVTESKPHLLPSLRRGPA
jgi:branched-chain amino acid transport system permease protein